MPIHVFAFLSDVDESYIHFVDLCCFNGHGNNGV